MTNAEPSTPTPEPSPARVRRVSVKNLFGRFNHEVDLRREECVTILIGPNGVGKTRLLELVAAIAHGRIDQLTGVPFDELRIDFDDGRAVVVRRAADAPPLKLAKPMSRRRPRRVEHVSVLPLELLLLQNGKQRDRWAPEEHKRDRASWDPRSHLPPWLAPLGGGRWMDERSGRVLNAMLVAEMYGVPEKVLAFHVTLPDWMNALFERSPVHLIETQRLVRWRPREGKRGDAEIDEQSVALAVEELAEDLAHRVAAAQSEYAREAQRLEKTYVERLLRPREVDEVSVPKLRARLGSLAGRRARLESLGLLAADEQASAAPSESLPPDQVRVLDLFAADLERKLNVLDPLARSIELLVGGVNAKFRDKKLRLSRPEGLVVECEPDGRPIEVQALSSGEQHELVLLFDLIFRVQRGTLVLIDEPELSLHPEWQTQFVDDLMSIAQNSQFDVLLATHSPYIVGTRSDLCVALRSESKK
jgi:energy-coupling factor transporter ATP-binding protein EcfA2